MRSATNPGGPGHEWVKRRFLLEGAQAGRLFVPARLDENPYLDKEEYEQSLQELPPHVRQQLQHGDWDALPPGEIFQRSWFKPIAVLPRGCRFVRYWDKAGTEGGKGARTAGVLVARTPDRRFCIADVVKGRYNAHERERVILQTAHADRARWENQQGGELSIWVEQEPGSGGKESADNTIRNLAGFSIRAERVTGDKVTRAQPLAAQAEAGNVDMLEGAWNGEFLDEIEAFPGALKDQVDGASGAFNKLAALPEEEEETYSTSGRGMTSARSTQHHNIRLRR
jgi:predicted phage terminase large subunit-like protein